MNNAEILVAAIQQIREIFLEKSELKGYDDWNSFLGSLSAIEQVAVELQEKSAETAEKEQE